MKEPDWEVIEDQKHPGEWRVERLWGDGSVDVVIFSGANATVLAHEYRKWKTQERQAAHPPLRVVR